MKKFSFLFLVSIIAATICAQTSTRTKNIVTDKLPGVDCDNVVHKDLLEGAPNRTPSECEVQFDWNVRTALQNAFSKTFQSFPSSDWEVADTSVEMLTGIGRGTEQNFFTLSYYFKIDLAQKSPRYMEWYNKYQNAMQQLQSQAGEASTKKIFGRFLSNE